MKYSHYCPRLSQHPSPLECNGGPEWQQHQLSHVAPPKSIHISWWLIVKTQVWLSSIIPFIMCRQWQDWVQVEHCTMRQLAVQDHFDPWIQVLKRLSLTWILSLHRLRRLVSSRFFTVRPVAAMGALRRCTGLKGRTRPQTVARKIKVEKGASDTNRGQFGVNPMIIFIAMHIRYIARFI